LAQLDETLIKVFLVVLACLDFVLTHGIEFAMGGLGTQLEDDYVVLGTVWCEFLSHLSIKNIKERVVLPW
jgi:hypothetical protein